MTESWLLFDEKAIRQVAGNPQGKQELNLPRISEVERILDPKTLLKNILSIAGVNSKRRRDDNIPIARLADLIEDFKPLKDLTAFQELEKELRNILSSNHLI